MWQSIRQSARLFTAFVVIAFLSVPASADTWTAPASELANKIIAKAGPGSAISISFANRSSLSASEAGNITSQIHSQLQASGMRFVQPAQAIATVTVTLSENAQGFLWIGEIMQGSSTDVVMTSVPRAPSAALTGTGAITLRRKLILTSDDQILDVATDADNTVVLTPEKVTWYRAQGAQLQELLSMPVKHSRPFPSDIRGRITNLRGGPLEISLPGVRCTQTNPQQASLDCSDTDDPWPMSAPGAPIAVNAFFSPVRNFFTGAVTFHDASPSSQSPDRSYDLPPFYSFAQIEEGGLPLWVFAGVNGRVTFFGGTSATTPTETAVRGWGSDIAAISAGCDNERYILAARDSDLNQPDFLQPFQVVNREVSSAAAPTDFAGPVTALWTSAISSDSAVAVSHNLKTDKYEAYSLSLVCNQ